MSSNDFKKLSKEMKLTLEDIEYVSINTFLENLGTLSPQRLKNILTEMSSFFMFMALYFLILKITKRL